MKDPDFDPIGKGLRGTDNCPVCGRAMVKTDFTSMETVRQTQNATVRRPDGTGKLLRCHYEDANEWHDVLVVLNHKFERPQK